MILNHIAIIVSSEEGVDFYKTLGFKEKSRKIRPESHDELICLNDGLITLEIYKDPTHPKQCLFRGRGCKRFADLSIETLCRA